MVPWIALRWVIPTECLPVEGLMRRPHIAIPGSPPNEMRAPDVLRPRPCQFGRGAAYLSPGDQHRPALRDLT